MQKEQNPLFEDLFRNYFKSLKNELNSKNPLYKDLLLPMEGNAFNIKFCFYLF